MERRDLEIFLTLAHELHFGRTAERLHVSQARVSQSIKQLERRIGTALFARTSRRVELTPVGRQFLEDVRPGYDLIKAGLERAVAAGRGLAEPLRVGFSSPLAGELVLAAASVYGERNPGAGEVLLHETPLNDPYGLLRSGALDLLLAQYPVAEADLRTGPVLISDTRVLAVAGRHRFARRACVTLDDLATEKLLSLSGPVPDYWLDHLLPRTTPGGRTVARGTAAATRQELLALVGAGQGVHPTAAHEVRYYARPNVTYVPITDAPPLEYGLTWRTATETSRIRAFGEAAAEVVRRDNGPARVCAECR
ncbi:LysR family transcriptional regulator [Streptomyces albofaciens JCM 4342]|uniref:LysR family transcriptional regulator n=1 Tax=Streptomyces albofaciens TaxID=66866 RepID=UPI00123BE83B|nr:LysR family transcriptional regulator [Streptomyces albofaciens]KAA6212013.1 LysR family transcriptional regulator [Streptomyces albofaciens JCM 4342]